MDFLKIANNIKKDGYIILPNFFTKEELQNLKKSLLDTLNYIDNDSEKDLQKKYYQIKKDYPKLKSHWYDIAPHNITLTKLLHKSSILEIIKCFFNSEVLFSGRPCIHVHDVDNDTLLAPHQETKQFARDNIVLWTPLFDTSPKKGTGGLAIYEKSHTHGYFEHSLDTPKDKKVWTKDYTHVKDNKVIQKFKRKELEINAGSLVLLHSALIHNGYPTSKEGFVRITITERFNPLQKIPFLKDGNAPLKIPYVGVDYNKITE